MLLIAKLQQVGKTLLGQVCEFGTGIGSFWLKSRCV